jgi:hypothetical protein
LTRIGSHNCVDWPLLVAVLVLAVGSAASRRAVADERTAERTGTATRDRIAFRVESSPHTGCPRPGEIEAWVLSRTAKARVAEPGEAAWVFHVEFQDEGRVVTGRMALDRDGQRSGTRSVSGRACSDVATALALTIALSIDPRAQLVPETAPAPALGAQPEAAAPPATSPALAPAATAVAPAAEAPARSRVRLGGALGVAQVVSGAVMPAASVAGEFALPWSGLFSPSVRLSINLASNALDASRDATFLWLSGQVDLCPFRLALASALELRPCAVAQGGLLRGRGRTAAEPVEASRAWWSAGASGQIAVSVSPSVGIELSGAAVVPFLERDFVFENPPRTIARTTTPSWNLALGGFVTFP